MNRKIKKEGKGKDEKWKQRIRKGQVEIYGETKTSKNEERCSMKMRGWKR